MKAAPLRLVTELTQCDAKRAEARWRPNGGEFGTPAGYQRPSQVPGILVLEALAQCAGLLLQQTDVTPDTHWLLSGVDDADVNRIGWGDEVALACTLQRRSSRAAKLTATAATPQGEVCQAKILMVRA